MNTRIILSIFLAALMLLIITGQNTAAEKPQQRVGKLPPQIEHDMGKIDLDSLKGQDVTVTFWSSDNAASRLENIKYAAEAQANPKRKHIGVNIDDEPELYKAYLLRDHLNEDSLQIRVEGEIAKNLAHAYGYTTVFN